MQQILLLKYYFFLHLLHVLRRSIKIEYLLLQLFINSAIEYFKNILRCPMCINLKSARHICFCI